MREFWLEPSPDISGETLHGLLESSSPDAVLLSHRTPSVKARIASHESGADIFLTANPGEVEASRKTGRTVALEVTIRDHQDHQKALRLLALQPDYLLISCPDWKVIPLENLIAEAKGRSKLIARTNSLEDSRTALATLELGVDGIALSSHDPNEIMKTRELLSGNQTSVSLTRASIVHVRPIGTGSRVCVDTCEIIDSNAGLLTGCSSQGLFLVEGEVHSNPHINPRPFRVNAGPVSLYVLTPGGKTRYLSELSAGEKVLLVDDRNGEEIVGAEHVGGFAAVGGSAH